MRRRAASWCQMDQHDRPIMGRLNWCPGKISTAAADHPSQVAVAKHEVAHALGFSSKSFPLFRDELGYPRTPRESDGEVAEAQVQKYTCSANGEELSAEMPATSEPRARSSRPCDPCCFSRSCHRKLWLGVWAGGGGELAHRHTRLLRGAGS